MDVGFFVQPKNSFLFLSSGPLIGDVLKSCAEKIKCSRIRSPVCATDGNTYNNECLVRVQSCVKADAGLKVVARGTCQNPLPADNSPPASSIEDPVRDAVILVQKRQAAQPYAGKRVYFHFYYKQPTWEIGEIKREYP